MSQMSKYARRRHSRARLEMLNARRLTLNLPLFATLLQAEKDRRPGYYSRRAVRRAQKRQDAK